MPLVTFDDRPIKSEDWKTIWTGTLKGRTSMAFDTSDYSLLKVFAQSWGNTVIFEIDLNHAMANQAYGASGYPYVGCGSGGVINSSSQWEVHNVTCCVNTSKNTFYNLNQGYSLGTSYNLRNNNNDYFVYRIDGLK